MATQLRANAVLYLFSHLKLTIKLREKTATVKARSIQNPLNKQRRQRLRLFSLSPPFLVLFLLSTTSSSCNESRRTTLPPSRTRLMLKKGLYETLMRGIAFHANANQVQAIRAWTSSRRAPMMAKVMPAARPEMKAGIRHRMMMSESLILILFR